MMAEGHDGLELMELLVKWHSEQFYEKLREQHVTVEVLKILKSTHVQKLIAGFPIGDQAVFEKNLEKWKNLNSSSNEPEMLKTSIGSIAAEPFSTSNSSHPGCKSEKVSVSDILKSTYNGKEILSFYENENVLHEEQRNILISTITKYVEAKGIECSISDCTEMEKEICYIFPNEKIDFYSNGKRGKIYNKLAYMKRLSKDIFKKEKNSPEEVIESESEENYLFYIQQIKSGNITASELDIFWRKTAQLRFRQIAETKSTAEVFKLWPEYIKPHGFQLVDIDFCLKYPSAKSLHHRWPQYCEKMLALLKTRITNSFVSKQLSNIESCKEEAHILAIFWNLHHLFPPHQKVQVDATGAKIRKKFSVLDSQEGFAILSSTLEELEAKLKLLKLQSRNIQPRLLIVGDTSKVKDIFIYIDDVKYPLLTILNAIDILFKIFFVFNLKYPDESDVFYTFVESFLYDLPMTTKYPKVSTIKHELLNFTL